MIVHIIQEDEYNEYKEVMRHHRNIWHLLETNKHRHLRILWLCITTQILPHKLEQSWHFYTLAFAKCHPPSHTQNLSKQSRNVFRNIWYSMRSCEMTAIYHQNSQFTQVTHLYSPWKHWIGQFNWSKKVKTYKIRRQELN